jgi:hypothetical protein
MGSVSALSDDRDTTHIISRISSIIIIQHHHHLNDH